MVQFADAAKDARVIAVRMREKNLQFRPRSPSKRVSVVVCNSGTASFSRRAALPFSCYDGVSASLRNALSMPRYCLIAGRERRRKDETA